MRKQKIARVRARERGAEGAEKIATHTLQIDEPRPGAKPAIGVTVVIDKEAWALRDGRAQGHSRTRIDDAPEIARAVAIRGSGIADGTAVPPSAGVDTGIPGIG